MSDWPPGMRVKPIIAWPGQASGVRISSPFSAKWSVTVRELQRELRALHAHQVVLQVAIAERDFRIDGFPKMNARANHPGVILSFDSKHGPLSYPCDRFTHWTDNLRAIMLAMEALRKVDRYGVTKRGEQYAGWKQLPAGGNGAAVFPSADEALAWMRKRSAENGLRADLEPNLLYRRLSRIFHPDAGGDPDKWDLLDQAKQVLTKAGLL